MEILILIGHWMWVLLCLVLTIMILLADDVKGLLAFVLYLVGLAGLAVCVSFFIEWSIM